MIDLPGLPLILQTGSQASDQSVASLGRLQQQGPAVGTALPLVKPSHHGLGKNVGEQQTLCCGIVRHVEASVMLQTASRQRVCSMGGFSCLQKRELSGLGQRRIPSLSDLRRETRAWNRNMNRKRITIDWKFTRKQARMKFRYKRNQIMRSET